MNRNDDWSRSFVNKNINPVKTMFRWAVVEKIVATSGVIDLECLPSLRKGKAAAKDIVARETPPVLPVAPEIVEKTILFMPPFVADMVRLQLLTGIRPGEICAMRAGDMDRSGSMWLYTPSTHKTEHLGHRRTVALGPQAQLILRRYLKDDPASVVFSPIEQEAVIKERKRKNRKTVQPSQVDRSKVNPMIKPGESFEERSYNRAIGRAWRRAGVERWHAHRLRHTVPVP